MWLLASLLMNSLIYRTPAEHQLVESLSYSLPSVKIRVVISVFGASSCLNFPWLWSPPFANCVVYFPIYIVVGVPAWKFIWSQEYTLQPQSQEGTKPGLFIVTVIDFNVEKPDSGASVILENICPHLGVIFTWNEALTAFFVFENNPFTFEWRPVLL